MKKRINISIKESYLEKIDSFCEKFRYTRSELMAVGAMHYMDKYKDYRPPGVKRVPKVKNINSFNSRLETSQVLKDEYPKVVNSKEEVVDEVSGTSDVCAHGAGEKMCKEKECINSMF